MADGIRCAGTLRATYHWTCGSLFLKDRGRSLYIFAVHFHFGQVQCGLSLASVTFLHKTTVVGVCAFSPPCCAVFFGLVSCVCVLVWSGLLLLTAQLLPRMVGAVAIDVNPRKMPANEPAPAAAAAVV